MTETSCRAGIVRILGEREGRISLLGPYGRAAKGLAIQADPRSEGFHVVLVSGNRSLLALGPFSEDYVVAEWRVLAAKTGLPLMLRLANGSTLTLMAQIGAVRLGASAPSKSSPASRRHRPGIHRDCHRARGI